jgi:6-pyruvoyltetrahydropterin/6-carboxytetrahydropterin synthase
MRGGYEVGSGVTVRALHRQPVEGPEGELHAHDYRIDVVVGRRELDQRGMVCDLDALRAGLRALAARLDGRDLEQIRPPDAEAVTVEVLARWAHGQLLPTLRQAGGETLAVRVWETGADFGGYAGPVA